VFAAGQVTVSARDGSLHSYDDPTFFVSPGLPPRRDARLNLTVIRAGSTVRIPDAEIQISTAGEVPQSCVTGEIGFCQFILRLPLFAVVDVSVRKSGYAPHQRQLTVNSERVIAAVELTPLGQ
jgi:hypothetical protein